MNLVIDSGNSAAKVGIFDDQRLIKRMTFTDLQALQSYMQQTQYAHVLISTVKDDAPMIASWAGDAKHVLTLERSLPLPVKNLYKTPETLGMDRLAAVCGAHALFPTSPCLVIDAGTCITYDFIDEHGRYHGGSISPGLTMRFRAVHTFTAKLPLLKPEPGVALIADTTETAIQSGVVNGMLTEIEGIIRQYQEKFSGLQPILCGGDGRFFENQLKASIFASPELVLIGLNSILIHNVNRF